MRQTISYGSFWQGGEYILKEKKPPDKKKDMINESYRENKAGSRIVPGGH